VTRPNIEGVRLVDPAVGSAIASHQTDQAQQLAQQRAAEALSDLAIARLAAGSVQGAIDQLRSALQIEPSSQLAFHNLTAIRLAHGLVRAEGLFEIQPHLARLWDTLPWAGQYRSLLYMPHFVNLEFVMGRCNLNCRMCIGSSARDNGKLEYMTAENFCRLLQAAPTIQGVTLSSGDSEPLLHPQFVEIVEAAKQHRIRLDVFTNGLPLTAAKCRTIVGSQVVTMVNFSLDAATGETFRRIRGADFEQVLKKIRMFQEMKAETGSALPRLSISFVAMADNVHELPAFVRLGKELGAVRVYVEDLIGWDVPDSPNRPATDHPQCADFIREARQLAEQSGVLLTLPARLRDETPTDAGSGPAESAPGEPAESGRVHRCGWINGIWVQRDGQIDPCCMVHNVADMGSIQDGPLLDNPKFCRVKDLLLQGKVFRPCLDQRMCVYVQQHKAAGTEPPVITEAELEKLGVAAKPASNCSICSTEALAAVASPDAAAEPSHADSLPVINGV